MFAFALLLTAACGFSAFAHPVSQGQLEVVVSPDRLTVIIRVSVQEALVSTSTFVDADDRFSARTLAAASAGHGRYLLKHFYFSANFDGSWKTLTGTLKTLTPPEGAENGIDPVDIERKFVQYELDYPFPDAQRRPLQITLKHDVLNEILYTPGQPWQASYFTKMRQDTETEYQSTLLTCNSPVTYQCAWTTMPATAPTHSGAEKASPPAAPHAQSSSLTGRYLIAGINHIVGFPDPGYDHLLFVSALVLAAVSFWDVIKVVTAFTLAHTLTLSLSVLKLVYVRESVVEPMIAASIVFVALQNIFWPKQTRGWQRLAAAFGFGLFHGLGFAGGLVNSMQGETGYSIGVAILAFSLGVEIGHQMVVLPFFGLLRWGRRRYPELSAQELFSARAMRYGSTMICMGGIFFLLAALKIIGAG